MTKTHQVVQHVMDKVSKEVVVPKSLQKARQEAIKGEVENAVDISLNSKEIKFLKSLVEKYSENKISYYERRNNEILLYKLACLDQGPECARHNVRLSLLNKVKEIVFGDGSAQERMVDIKALFSNEA